MYTIRINSYLESQGLEAQLHYLTQRPPSWVMMYGPDDAPFEAVMAIIRGRFPEAPVFGATSFRGVFSAHGFSRDIVLLVAEKDDGIKVAVSLQRGNGPLARAQAVAACNDIKRELRRRPGTVLMHATPGFEERVLEGIFDNFGTEVPVYGGSAADDALCGRWRVFGNGVVCNEGFLLVGISSLRPPLGSFVGGFLPTEHGGIVTKADGRTVYEIDGSPAAAVYDRWTDGAIARELVTGGSVLSQTSLLPLARALGDTRGMPRRLLSHPHEVLPGTHALRFFSEFTSGDKVTLMTSAREPLVSRVRRAVQRARGSSTTRAQGALLVYCGGSLGGFIDQADAIAAEFAAEVAGVPFVGLATFGEQGTFFNKSESWHGNLMCAAVLF